MEPIFDRNPHLVEWLREDKVFDLAEFKIRTEMTTFLNKSNLWSLVKFPILMV